MVREPKTFDFDLRKDVDRNFKHEAELVVKSNYSREQLFSKHKHENNIFEHRKQ